MAEFPAMPLWTDAYLGDTTHLTTIEHGAYLLLLMVAWRSRDNRLADDDRLLARYAKMTPAQWRRAKPILSEFFTVKDGFWTQRRLTDEAAAVKQYREKQRAAGQASAMKRKGRHSTAVESGCNQNQPPTPTPIPNEEPKGSSPPVVPIAKAKSKRAGALPQDFEPDLSERAQAIVDGWPPGKFDAEFRKFRDHACDKNRVSHDWQAAFRTWINNADEWMKKDERSNKPARDTRDGYLRAVDRELGIG